MKSPTYDLVKNKVFNQWLKKELILKTKEKVKKSIKSKNYKLSSKYSLKRNDNALGDLKDPFLINKIFEIDDKDIDLLVTANNLIAVKIIETRTDDYKFDKKIFNDLNQSFSKSFFNDILNMYVQHLSLKHDLRRNYEELENYFIRKENVFN